MEDARDSRLCRQHAGTIRPLHMLTLHGVISMCFIIQVLVPHTTFVILD